MQKISSLKAKALLPDISKFSTQKGISILGEIF
jgi:hypothetical protein